MDGENNNLLRQTSRFTIPKSGRKDKQCKQCKKYKLLSFTAPNVYSAYYYYYYQNYVNPGHYRPYTDRNPFIRGGNLQYVCIQSDPGG